MVPRAADLTRPSVPARHRQEGFKLAEGALAQVRDGERGAGEAVLVQHMQVRWSCEPSLDARVYRPLRSKHCAYCDRCAPRSS